MLIAHELRNIRVAEETSLIKSEGHPVPLPTGYCSLIVPLGANGTVSARPLTQCDNPVLASDMIKAVTAAAPFKMVPANVTQIHLSVNALDMEPGVGKPPAS
jgi:hypothetical protein